MQALSFDKKNFISTEPFQGLFTQGMVCHETYKDENNKWLSPEEVFTDNVHLIALPDKSDLDHEKAERHENDVNGGHDDPVLKQGIFYQFSFVQVVDEGVAVHFTPVEMLVQQRTVPRVQILLCRLHL